MKIDRNLRSALIGLGMALLAQPVAAASCAEFIAPGDSSSPRQECVCDASLRKLQASLPSPLKLVAACALRWPDNQPIDLRRQKISLDQYTGGHYPHGEFFITGRRRMSGQLHYEPGNAGDAWFTPSPVLIARRHEALSAALHAFKFVGDGDMAQFPIPVTWRHAPCFTAEAVIDIDGIRLLLGENDEAGAYPARFKVVSLRGFQKCAGE